MGCLKDSFNKFKKTYFYLFIKDFIDIGNSAGSLLIQAITLFRTFQRLTAPKEFKTKFPHEFQVLFTWAKNLFDVITKNFRTNPLNEFETFNIYTLIFPLTILTFISTTHLQHYFLIFIFLLAAFFGLGIGIAYVKIEMSYAPAIMGPMGGFIFLFLLIYTTCYSPIACCCKKKEKQLSNDEDDENEKNSDDQIYKGFSTILYFTRFTFSTVLSGLIFYASLIPIMLKRWRLTKIISIIMGIIPAPLFFIELILKAFLSDRFTLQEKMNGFLIKMLTLLIIPATEAFSTLIQNDIKNKSFAIASYFGVSFLIPLALLITMIIVCNPDIKDKYKESKYNIFYYFELIDVLKQVGYAFAAAYDYLWVCLFLEVAWAIAIIAVRPFDDISEHFLSIGNSIVLIISNSVFLHSKKNDHITLNYGLSIFFFVLACIPAVLSFYIFFIFDFLKDGKIEEDEDEILDEKLENIRCAKKVSIVASIISPIGWFCYGLMFPTIANINE